MDKLIREKLLSAAGRLQLDVVGGRVRRSSSRFCLGVEHGDYNGMELFGVGTDRFIWLVYKPNDLGRVRVYSENFPEDGVVDFGFDERVDVADVHASWARFPYGVAEILRREGFQLKKGFDAVLYGNIPGGGMSRSASLALNLILTFLEVNGIEEGDGMRVVELAQLVETDYIGSPCGQLDQIMIYFARKGMGTYFDPATGKVDHVPFGGDADAFRIVSLDTGTKRPGLEKSTYKVRRGECDHIAELLKEAFDFDSIASVNTKERYDAVVAHLEAVYPAGIPRVKYLYEAGQRFNEILQAWRSGDITKIGSYFRADGIGLRDDYQISGKELETMCDIIRSVDGVYGERMLGGGDKGASGALVRTSAFDAVKEAVERAYPLAHPEYAGDYAIHVCRTVDGIVCEPLGD